MSRFNFSNVLGGAVFGGLNAFLQHNASRDGYAKQNRYEVIILLPSGVTGDGDGMGTSEMEEVANFYARVLIKSEDPAMVKQDVRDFKSQYHTIRYCFNEDDASGYPL